VGDTDTYRIQAKKERREEEEPWQQKYLEK
jgi:hypothetical protein